ncbi:MAG TPA: AraC family transcriptional regulator [Candidatus Saccharimonas sp.]|nr:AraC family transcriptional regulator [Candidatus Saccharimonas sp.]
MAKRLQKSANALPELKALLDPVRAAQHFRVERYLPSAALAPFVEYYWISRWSLEPGQRYTAEILPDACVNLAFRADRGWLTGVTTGKYEYEVRGRGVIAAVKFTPGGFRAFWPHTMTALTDRTLPAVRVFRGTGPDFRRQLTGHLDADIVARLEALLLEHRPAVDANLRRVASIIQAVVDDPSIRTVQEVLPIFNLSERTLQHLFQTHVGAGLKWIIMRCRLQEAARLALINSAPNWTHIAAELGYADQSHFVNDFKQVMGKTPTQYAKELAGFRPGQL